MKLCRNCRAVDTAQDFVGGYCAACARMFIVGGVWGMAVLVVAVLLGR